MTEQEAIERIASALTKRFIFSPGDQEDVDMATVAWNEMKAIALEQRVDVPSFFKTAYAEQVRQMEVKLDQA